MDKIERCAVCGDIFSGDDEKIYCPECGSPMHKDCYEIEGKCPVEHNSPVKASSDVPQDDTENGSGGQAQRPRSFPGGNGCEICGRPFSADDERVYCPDCGASMHRLCYNMTHRCPFEEEHTPRPYFTGNIPGTGKNSRPVCDRCGKDLDNGEEKVYCPECGTPVHRSCWESKPVCPNEELHAQGYDWEKAHSAQNREQTDKPPSDQYDQDRIYIEKFPDMILDHPIRSADSGEELTCRGVKQKELLHFLGVNNFSTPRFFALFMNMANTGRVISLNIPAWFFMPFYHFYRRMTGPAIILTFATFVLMVPSLISQIVYFYGAGAEQAVNMPVISIANITSTILILVRVAMLLFNDYIYMRWSVSKILSLRERYKEAPQDEYYAALEHSGNPRMMYVLGGLSLIFALVYLLNLFISISGMIG